MRAREVRDHWADIISWVRVLYYRFMGVAVGEGCYISLGAHIDVRRGKIVLGNTVHIASGSYILAHTGCEALK